MLVSHIQSVDTCCLNRFSFSERILVVNIIIGLLESFMAIICHGCKSDIGVVWYIQSLWEELVLDYESCSMILIMFTNVGIVNPGKNDDVLTLRVSACV